MGSVSAVETADVVVVGARCAGSATAVALARAGRHVIAVDAAAFPSDTLSTHLLWPAGVAELRRMGALDRVLGLGAPPLTTALAAGSGYEIRARFPEVDGVDYALCVRRVGLDAALVATARAAGVEVRERCRVTEVIRDGDRVVGVRYTDRERGEREVRAALVVGGDGRRSTVARAVRADHPYRDETSGRSCYFAYWTDPHPTRRRVAAQWRVGALLGTAFPCDDGLVLCLVQPPVDFGRRRPAHEVYREAVDAIAPLAHRLHGCEMVGRVRSATDLMSYFRRSSGPGWALPGDAGHFKDPVTAQGIRDALRYGRLLGEAVADVLDEPRALDAALREWEDRRERECLGMYRWTNRLARGTAMGPLEIELYRTATRDTRLAAATLEVMSRTRRPTSVLGPTGLAGLAARAFLRADGRRREALTQIADEVRDLAEASLRPIGVAVQSVLGDRTVGLSALAETHALGEPRRTAS
ncbi:NAD(P)/FAD-dependent oxidoreductase [Nocardia arizonensis]|uniref:NAD(P)/FAD-dependent oxidoreductase n=1 Tax=Nocardia arizonensis TaxID=1141647 RepID=UPI0009EB95B1|nr:FAD-dependent monooxygenase [Nocardia arizonensis]